MGTDYARLHSCNHCLCKYFLSHLDTYANRSQLPLSFMSSFFAIGVDEFPHNQDSGEVSWPLGVVAAWLCKFYCLVVPSLSQLTRYVSRYLNCCLPPDDLLCFPRRYHHQNGKTKTSSHQHNQTASSTLLDRGIDYISYTQEICTAVRSLYLHQFYPPCA